MNQKAARFFVLEEKYSTTRHVNRTPPVSLNKPSDKIHSMLFLPETSGRKAEGGLRTQGLFKCNTIDKPLISVITVVFNGAQHIEQTITSIIGQTYDNVEYIIVDGGSTDNTLNDIKKYESQIDYWVSESDKGIADAMNKGLSLATGEYILFIHADDYLNNSDSLKFSNVQFNNIDIIILDILYGVGLKRLTPRGLNFWINFKTGVYHQAALCKLRVFKNIGGFDTDLKIAMDYDFFLRTYRYGFKAKKVPLLLSVMRDTGVSSRTDWQSLNQRFEEEKKVHQKNCHSKFMVILYKLYWLLYIPYRKLVFKKQL
jgi:glycosyltransferase involved in cell wall biosynthesis